MTEVNVSKLLATICVFVAAYIFWLLLSGLGAVYSQALDWSSGSAFVAFGISFFILASPLSALGAAYLIYKRKRVWILALLSAHVFLAVTGYPSTIFVGAVIVWWLSRYAYSAT